MFIKWFAGRMKKIFNVEVKMEEVSYEAYDFCNPMKETLEFQGLSLLFALN